MAKLAKPSGNPIEIIQDPRVVSTAGGVALGYYGRKAIYASYRDLFGWATKDPSGSGKIIYVKVGKDGKPTNEEVKDAKTKRILLNLFGVVLGTLLMGYGEESNSDVLDSKDDSTLAVKYVGLGLASGSFVNVVSALLDME